MFFDDHNPPHFHAEYAEHSAVFAIESLALMQGKLSPRAMGLVAEWAALHQDELRQDWERAQRLEPLQKIEPLA